MPAISKEREKAKELLSFVPKGASEICLGYKEGRDYSYVVDNGLQKRLSNFDKVPFKSNLGNSCEGALARYIVRA